GVGGAEVGEPDARDGVDLEHADGMAAVTAARSDMRLFPATEGERDRAVDEAGVEALLEEEHGSRYGVPVFGVDKAGRLARLGHVMVKGIPWNAALGFVVEDVAEGLSVLKLPYRPELTGNPATGALHGGVVTSLLDAACGQSVFLKVQRLARVATLDLRIDY